MTATCSWSIARRGRRTASVVVARIGDELTIKRLCVGKDGRVWLCPANPAYSPIEITPECDFEV